MDRQERGYFVLPRFLGDEPCARLRRACDHVLEQVLAELRRRAFDVIYAYGPPPAFGEPAPTDTFRDPEILRRLAPGARAFLLASLA